LKIKRVLVPVLILVLVAAAAFWLTGCTGLQVLKVTVSHRGYLESQYNTSISPKTDLKLLV
jgi:hypothetical protein